ncbi:MAG: dTDP-4-dehydrorhamnose 3,5-epimerase family protein [Pedobacter agri]
MIFTNTNLEGVYLIDYTRFQDRRGEFVKTIHSEEFEKAKLDYEFKESFYSTSQKDVIRGMHFQDQPNDHCKLVNLVMGKILDVVVDLRNNSSTFGHYFSTILTKDKPQGLYIGKGFAHGFLSLENDSIIEYHTTTVQNKASENGIRFDSFDFDWGISSPIMSERDMLLEPFRKDKIYFK